MKFALTTSELAFALALLQSRVRSEWLHPSFRDSFAGRFPAFDAAQRSTAGAVACRLHLLRRSVYRSASEISQHENQLRALAADQAAASAAEAALSEALKQKRPPRPLSAAAGGGYIGGGRKR